MHTAQIWTKFANLGYTRSSLLRMKLRLILINHFTAKVKNADLVDVRKLKKQNNNSYKKLIIISSTEREKDTASNNKLYFSSRCRQQRVLIN